jgi:hypothetical protein
MNPESGHKFKDPNAYSEDEIRKKQFFKHLQEDESFEWFFHTDDSWIPDLDDYQMIALRNVVRSSPSYGILYVLTNAAIFKLIVLNMIIEFLLVSGNPFAVENG